MKCPVCIKENLTSRVYGGLGQMTSAYYPPFWDEDGKHHEHDANRRTSHYVCSLNHQWQEVTSGSCWCGWTGGKKKVIIKPDMEGEVWMIDGLYLLA